MPEPTPYRKEQWRQLRECWKERIEGWRQSGLTQTEYCRVNDLNWHRFVYWKKRLKKEEPVVSFVPVNIGALPRPHYPDRTTAIRVLVGNRFKIEIAHGFDARLLGQVLLTLENLS